LHYGRLGAMSTKRSLDGGPKRASRSSTEGADPLTRMVELYQHRERLQLGLDFHVIGNLHDWTREWTDAVLPTPRISATTRMMCWNAGGGAGTLKDDDKLRFLTLAMLQQHIHVACLTEGKARCKDLQAALKRIGMNAHFRAEGKNGTVACRCGSGEPSQVLRVLNRPTECMALCAPLRAASRARARNRSRAACRSAPAEARPWSALCVCVQARACVRACAHLRARAYACAHMCVGMRVCMHASVCARANVRAAYTHCRHDLEGF
jgi:hypothetical protein